MTLHVLDPGLHTLLVDFGRPRSRSLGVPVGGAADQMALALGNGLVGNPPDAAGLEISLTGPTLQATCTVACVLYGAPFQLASDRQRLKPGVTFTLRPGEEVRIGTTATDMRAYLCVHGGFEAPRILGSRSALEPLHAGAELTCPASCLPARFLPPFLLPRTEINLLRVLAGPQADWFPANALQGQEFTVTPASNRMGLRLRGRPLDFSARELTSEPVCPGTVQVTRDGQSIILGVDGQTIGGYPKISQVICADLDKLGQLRWGERLRFQEVSLQEAELLYQRKRRFLQEWLLRLRTAEVFAS
jgi:antagonist of KipI